MRSGHIKKLLSSCTARQAGSGAPMADAQLKKKRKKKKQQQQLQQQPEVDDQPAQVLMPRAVMAVHRMSQLEHVMHRASCMSVPARANSIGHRLHNSYWRGQREVCAMLTLRC